MGSYRGHTPSRCALRRGYSATSIGTVVCCRLDSSAGPPAGGPVANFLVHLVPTAGEGTDALEQKIFGGGGTPGSRALPPPPPDFHVL